MGEERRGGKGMAVEDEIDRMSGSESKRRVSQTHLTANKAISDGSQWFQWLPVL